ncbi:MAG: ABC transporter, partial [Gammaproteobacteria bacterium]|nr:ABC transporter [Gammaproteobacteria bacterium]
NLALGLNILNWLNTDDTLIAIHPKSAPDLTIELNDSETAIIGLGFLVILPLLLSGTGVFIWQKRRKRL